MKPRILAVVRNLQRYKQQRKSNVRILQAHSSLWKNIAPVKILKKGKYIIEKQNQNKQYANI